MADTAYGTFRQGSEGSRLNSENIKAYKDEKLDEYSPSVTDRPFECTPSSYIAPTNSEQIRRDNNRRRDHRKRFAVITSPLAVDTDSIAESVADKNAAKKTRV
jgi:hypothetical protein